MSKNSFLKGAFILGMAGLVVKILGAFFRIPLGNIIGSEGMGYYQTSYPIYVLLLTISSAGFPTAISKMVAEKRALGDNKGAHRVFKISFVAMIVLGILTSSLLFFGAGFIVGQLKNPKAFYSMVAIAPALLFVPIMAAYRGYFQGRNNMTPTAVSQIIEQFGRVILGLGLGILFLKKGTEFAAAGAAFGATAGAVFGTIFMVLIYYMSRKKIKREVEKSENFKEETTSTIMKQLLFIAVPITIGASVLPIMNMIDVSVVMSRLQASGFTQAEANSLYGQLTGMAATLINLPQVLTMALAMSLVPVISHSFALGDLESARKDTKTAIKTALLLGIPAGAGLMVLATPIMQLLYPKEPAEIGQILFVLSVGVIFLSLIQTLTGILQGMGKAHIPVVNLLIGSIVKVCCTYFLTAIPSLNVKGAAIGTVAAYTIAALLDLYYVKKLLGIKFDKTEFVIKPFLSVGLMSASVLITYKVLRLVLGNSLSTIGGIGVGVIVYGIMLLLTGGISRKDLETNPKGKKLAKILGKTGLLK